jgi:antitoxin FitA
MAQILIRELDDETKQRLQSRARSHGRSMEAEVRDILRDAVKVPAGNTKGLGSDIKRLFDGIGLENDEQIKEWKGFELKNPFET